MTEERKFVLPPGDHEFEPGFEDYLDDFRVPVGAQRLLADLYRRVRGHIPVQGAQEDIDERVAQEVADAVKPFLSESSDHATTLLVAALALALFPVGAHPAENQALLTALASALHDENADYSDAVLVLLDSLRGPDKHDLKFQIFTRPVFRNLLASLLAEGLLRLEVLIKPESIRDTRPSSSGSQYNAPARQLDPNLPDFWIHQAPARAMTALALLVEREPGATLPLFLDGLKDILALKWERQSRHLYPYMGPLTLALCRRWFVDGAGRSRELTRWCWLYLLLARDVESVIAGVDLAPFKALALEELGRVRPFYRAEAEESATELESRIDYLDAAISFLLVGTDTPLWGVLRRLLLALRESLYATVPSDLRSWDEPDLERVPKPWSWVSERITAILNVFLGREQKNDPDLFRLRGEFASFCLERLKTRERGVEGFVTNEANLVEPNKFWRIGYLHALDALKVNPRGKGHQALARCAENDPDIEVRELAGRVGESMRRRHRLPPGSSPRRAIFTALWCLKQAHLLALDKPVLDEGANRTLRKEVRRARDTERMEAEGTASWNRPIASFI